MAQNTNIGWCDDSYNAWWGCTKVSPGCKHCYAENTAARFETRTLWRGERKQKGDPNNPRRWNAAARRQEKMRWVFTNSMADVFDDHPAVTDWRQDLFKLTRATPWLMWLMLTKRPENIPKMVPEKWLKHGFPSNIAIGISAENQEWYNKRLPFIRDLPVNKFLSLEPLLDEVRLSEKVFDWVIIGGESSPNKSHARPCRKSWIEAAVVDARSTGAAVFVKQLGTWLANEYQLPRKGDQTEFWPATLAALIIQERPVHWEREAIRVHPLGIEVKCK